MKASPFVKTALGKRLVCCRCLIDEACDRIFILRTDGLDEYEGSRYVLQAMIDRFSNPLHGGSIHALWLYNHCPTLNVVSNIKAIGFYF